MNDYVYLQNEPVDFRSQNGWIAWIDILNFRTKSLEEMERILERLSLLSVIASQKLANVFIVGDAICITENGKVDGRSVVQVAINISAVLFNENHPHRGFITKGAFAFNFNHAFLPYVTGPGIVEALLEEQKLDFCGVVIKDELKEELKDYKLFDGREELIYIAKSDINPGRSIISTKAHLDRALKYSTKHEKTHPKSAKTKEWAEKLTHKRFKPEKEIPPQV